MSRIYRDNKGGIVEFSENHGADSFVTFEDATTKLLTRPNKHGFYETVVSGAAGNPVTSYQFAGVQPHDSGEGYVKCQGREVSHLLGLVKSEYVNATVPVVDAVTRREIEIFFEKHPEIKAKILADEPGHMTMMDGKPASLSELGQHASPFTACPANDVTKIVEGPIKR